MDCSLLGELPAVLELKCGVLGILFPGLPSSQRGLDFLSEYISVNHDMRRLIVRADLLRLNWRWSKNANLQVLLPHGQ